MTSALATQSTSTPPPRRTRKRKIALISLGVAVFGIALLWILVHRIPWMGPLVANTLRAIIGSENVTRLEEFVYGVEDKVNQGLKQNDKPKAYWTVPSAPKVTTPPAGEITARPPFRPASVGPVHKSWSAPGDGDWVPIIDETAPGKPPVLYKTLLHPDRNRSWAEVFVVAMDLHDVEVHPMLGTREPSATEPVPDDLPRPGVIPERDRARVLAAFNGGFMTEHGKWGMMLDGVTIVKPRAEGCTIATYRDDSTRIASFQALESSLAEMLWYRQAPVCMAEGGKLHPLLESENIRKWGATLDGNTVIRRSALGIDKDRHVLYMGISNHTTAPVMAHGMLHAGAWDVAQLDVNWSYPKFVSFERLDAGADRSAVALAEGFEFSPDEYIRKSSLRDFFYLTRRDDSKPKP